VPSRSTRGSALREVLNEGDDPVYCECRSGVEAKDFKATRNERFAAEEAERDRAAQDQIKLCRSRSRGPAPATPRIVAHQAKPICPGCNGQGRTYQQGSWQICLKCCGIEELF
jgi:hypothetical protein